MQAKKVVNYVESEGDEEDDDDDVFTPPPRTAKTSGRALKRRKTEDVSEEEDYSRNVDLADEIDEGQSTISRGPW